MSKRELQRIENQLVEQAWERAKKKFGITPQKILAKWCVLTIVKHGHIKQEVIRF